MTSRSRTLVCLFVTWLAVASANALAQDTPLYRDPLPTEGPRIEGPLLPARPPSTIVPPPPPSDLGPFQPSSPEGDTVGPIREPLLGVPPIPPPLPAYVVPVIQPGGDVVIKRTTKIRGPNGVLGQFHDWFHDVCFGHRRPSNAPVVPRRSLFTAFHASPETDNPTRIFSWPSWPSWPIPKER